MFDRMMKWAFGSEEEMTQEQSTQLREYYARYSSHRASARYRWISAKLGQRRLFKTPVETWVCSDCGALVARTVKVDGIQLHEDWHWRVDRVAGPAEA